MRAFPCCILSFAVLTGCTARDAASDDAADREANAGATDGQPANLDSPEADDKTGVAEAAQADPVGVPIFECVVGHKTVRVTANGDTLTYSFGSAGNVELTLSGGPNSNNIHWLTQRFAGMEYQLRFANGDASYIVYSAEGNGASGARPVSGLVVMRDGKTIADMACADYTEFAQGYDFSRLPVDDEAWSAM